MRLVASHATRIAPDSPLGSRLFWMGIALAALLFATPWIAQAQSLPGIPTPQAARQITAPVDESDLTAVPGGTPPLAESEIDQGRVSDSLRQGHILMLLRSGALREKALAWFMNEQYDPQSPFFHKWLTPEQFGEFFGPSSEDINQVTHWLERHGFTVNRVSSGRTFIDFSGTAGEVTAAFHTEIHRYRRDGKDHFANTWNPLIPTALTPLVSGFRALNNFHPKPLLPSVETGQGKTSHLVRSHLNGGTGALATHLVSPQDLAQIYGIKQLWRQNIQTPNGIEKLVGTGQTIAIVGDTDLASGDIQSFRDQFGITALGPNGSVVVDHPPASVCAPPDPAYNSPEGYVDAEWAGAAAPDATIDFVTCGDAGVTSGTDLAATYIVQNAELAGRIGVLSSSYGFCEKNPISETDAFYVKLWQQAAAEGITVIVAAGDAGSAECDEFTNVPYAVQGAWVSAEASTPYNIAAGGTDFSDTFSGTTSRYWSARNNPTFQSARSYIPETTWNETCASPLVLQAFGQGLKESSGPDGFCTYASQQPTDPNWYSILYFSDIAGSGGLSAISSKPPWQTGVYGIPKSRSRAVPDISIFSSSGSTSGHALVLCDSGLLPAGQTCDFSNPAVVDTEQSGGTSFAAPTFAGIVALIDQKSGDRQGQANYVLYGLAGEQYVRNSGATQPSLATCAAYLGADALHGCYFHDISGTPNPDPATRQQTPFLIGNIAVPCTGSATAAGVYTDTSTDPASNREDCYGYEITVTQNGNSLTTTPNYYGILSTSDSAASPAYSATPGYDLATGLGSPNAVALVNAPQWSSGGKRAMVRLTSRRSKAGEGGILLEAAVRAQSWGMPAWKVPVESGRVTFFSAGQPLGTIQLRCGGDGKAALSLPQAAFGGAGPFNDVYAFYSGGTARCSRESATYYYGTSSNTVTLEVAADHRR